MDDEALTIGQDIAIDYQPLIGDKYGKLASRIDQAVKEYVGEITADRDYHAARARAYEAECDRLMRRIDAVLVAATK